MKRRKWTYAIFAFVILLLGLLFFSEQSSKTFPTMEQTLANEVESNQAPSVQYYFFNEDSILHAYHAGFANIATRRTIDVNTTYNAYSVTKTFTALAVLQLAEQGKLSIDKPMIQYLPDFPFGNDITIRHVLSHSAGIPNPIPLSWIHLTTEQDSFNRRSFFKSVFEKNNKVKSKPNEKFAYSNLGYVLLGELIEKISGKSYEAYIRENIIQKLDLTDKDLSFTIMDSHSHATGYHKRMSFSNLIIGFLMDKSKFMDKPEGSWRPFKPLYVNGASYGGLISKPTAFVKYVQELLKDSSNLISPRYKQMLFQENKDNTGKNTGMCLSWFTGQLNGHSYFTHAGGGGGYYCEIRIYPDLKMGSVIFFNRTGMKNIRYLDKVDRFYIK